MIEILLKNKDTIKVNRIEDVLNRELDFHVMQLIDHDDVELNWIRETYGIDISIMEHYEDIEISSHFLENDKQAAFHFSIPFYTKEKKIIEEPIFIIISKDGLFLFSSARLHQFFNTIYPNKILMLQKQEDSKSMFTFQFEFISDYFADITEGLTKRIKNLANEILIEKDYSNDKVMDTITEYNFNNLLVKEALIETTRVFKLYSKSNWEQNMRLKKTIKAELNDLNVISDYIQFNFDRLDDLKENVSNKVDLEQNHIFKMLTVVTVCISLPTFIAGVYGMNFEKMPELKSNLGYPIVLIVMIFAAVLPFLYFKRKKWF